MKYQLFTKLQDKHWELTKENDDVKVLVRYAKELINGPLGQSCMYEIVNSLGGISYNNYRLFKLAGKRL